MALRRAAWSHPEWTVAAVCGAAWVATIATHTGHRPGAPAGVASGIGDWLLMCVAMMAPAAMPAARRVALSGLWRRRQVNIALFAGASVATWAVLGTAAVPLAFLAGPAPLLTGVLLVLAAAWELTPWKRRALRGAHRVATLPPRGRRAVSTTLLAGARHGWSCVRSCWLLMAAAAAAGHTSLVVMLLVTCVAAAESWSTRGAHYGATTATILIGSSLLLSI